MKNALTTKIAKNTKRITISDKSHGGLKVRVILEEWKRKHWWSFKYSWCVTDGTETNSDDREMSIQYYLTHWINECPDINIINTSTWIKYSPDFLKRKILTEKVVKTKRKPRSIKAKKVICVDDGTLHYYDDSDSEDFRDGITLNDGKKYWAWEHYSNVDRLESFEKFLIVRNNLGVQKIYPKRFFKEI